ncbi:MAG TPA: hypothetical protein VFC78_19560 [Tepidisphaeraceae bacterium]|nr:hypothetical protein [Tepidisphaeraceae bacterium]
MPQSRRDSPSDLPLAALHHPRGGKVALWLTAAFIALLVVCSFWLRRPEVMITGETLTYDRALFLSFNAGTLCGFQQSIGFNDFNAENPQGPAIVLLLTVSGSLFAMIVGAMAAVRVLRMRYTDGQVILAAIIAELLAILLGTAALITGGAGLSEAIHQAACAFGNSGVVIADAPLSTLINRNAMSADKEAAGKTGAMPLADSPGNTSSDPREHPRRFPGLATWQAQGVLLPLSILGGLGLPVLMELYDLIVGARRLSRHSRMVLALAAGVYLAATYALFISLLPGAATWAGRRWALGAASTAAVNARTAGLPFEFLRAFPGPAQWLVVLLMMIGASPAGTGSGLKATTCYHLFAGIRDALRGRPVRRTFGIAAVWMGGYVLAAGAGFLALTATQPQMPADRLIFLTISAISNVGLSHDPISIVGPGLFLLAALMLFGRLAPLAVLWWMVRTTNNAEVLVA